MSVATSRSDTQIKADVLAEFKWDSRVDASEIEVHVHNGIVNLTGTVSAHAKRLVTRDAAHRVHGVMDVVDDLRVATGVERPDEDIAQAVRHALRWDIFVPADRITSTVSTGTVILRGMVDSWRQRHDAELAVQGLEGVRGVVNEICIATQTSSAEQIKRQIEAALERHAEREARRIGVTVRDGVVTLTGTVRSWGEKSSLDRTVSFAPGVRRVDDRTTVDPYS